MNRIQVGDIITSFTLKDQNGNDFDISNFLGRKKLVIFFYPQDGSLNCTKEACYFKDLADIFDEAETFGFTLRCHNCCASYQSV